MRVVFSHEDGGAGLAELNWLLLVLAVNPNPDFGHS